MSRKGKKGRQKRPQLAAFFDSLCGGRPFFALPDGAGGVSGRKTAKAAVRAVFFGQPAEKAFAKSVKKSFAFLLFKMAFL